MFHAEPGGNAPDEAHAAGEARGGFVGEAQRTVPGTGAGLGWAGLGNGKPGLLRAGQLREQ